MKLRITTVSELEIEDLADWEADTLEAAAANAKRWVEDGTMALHDCTEEIISYTIEGVE